MLPIIATMLTISIHNVLKAKVGGKFLGRAAVTSVVIVAAVFGITAGAVYYTHLRALYGVQTAERANKSIIVTSSYFTGDAQRLAEQQNTLIDLFDIDDLIRLMENSIQNEQNNV